MKVVPVPSEAGVQFVLPNGRTVGYLGLLQFALDLHELEYVTIGGITVTRDEAVRSVRRVVRDIADRN